MSHVHLDGTGSGAVEDPQGIEKHRVRRDILGGPQGPKDSNI